MTTYQISEIFHTVQGEGMHTGVPATFIRTQGCTVGCSWCDTKYTWAKGGTRMTVDEIMKEIDFMNRHVVITGGEPLLHNLDPLLLALKDSGRYTQIETSGQMDFKGKERPCWITCSPKENLGFKIAPSVMDEVREIKWVVDENLQCGTVLNKWSEVKSARLGSLPNFILMPEGTPPGPANIKKALEWLEMIDFKTQAYWRFGDRLQWRIEVQ